MGQAEKACMTMDTIFTVGDIDFTTPWEVSGFNLEDVPCLRTFYCDLMLDTSSLTEMVEIVNDFGWLALDAKMALTKLDANAHARVKRLIRSRTATKELSPVIFPVAMLYGYLVGEKFGIPQFYGASQWARAITHREG